MKKLGTLLITLVTTACSSTHNEWDCPRLTSPYQCVNSSEVDKVIEKKFLQKESNESWKEPKIWVSPLLRHHNYQPEILDEVIHD